MSMLDKNIILEPRNNITRCLLFVTPIQGRKLLIVILTSCIFSKRNFFVETYTIRE